MNRKSVIEKWREMYEQDAKGKNAIEAVHYFEDGKPVGIDFFDRAAEEIAEILELDERDTLLEVGCGTGLFLERFNKTVSHVVGVDIACNMVKRIKYPGCCSDASHLPFKDNCFTKVVSIGVFPLFPDLEYVKQATLEMLRVCKPGGKVLITDIMNSRLEPFYIGYAKSKRNFSKRIKMNLQNFVRTPYYKIKYGQKLPKADLFFIDPSFFKALFRDKNNIKVYMLLDIADKPDIYLIFRYNVLINIKK